MLFLEYDQNVASPQSGQFQGAGGRQLAKPQYGHLSHRQNRNIAVLTSRSEPHSGQSLRHGTDGR